MRFASARLDPILRPARELESPGAAMRHKRARMRECATSASTGGCVGRASMACCAVLCCAVLCRAAASLALARVGSVGFSALVIGSRLVISAVCSAPVGRCLAWQVWACCLARSNGARSLWGGQHCQWRPLCNGDSPCNTLTGCNASTWTNSQAEPLATTPTRILGPNERR